jgi:RNA polymerase sigma-70 factor (ECF subfamily)
MHTMTTMDALRTDERALLHAAQRGDESAYRELVESHRSELHAHCYRMLASVHDADDAVQEALVRAWKGLPRFEGRSSVRTWLFKIATNATLDAVQGRARRGLPVEMFPPAGPGQDPGPALFESPWLEPYPDQLLGAAPPPVGPDARYEARESLELAFVAALQYLTAHQRAVLIIRDVLGFSALETAELLGTTVPAVNSALQRARAAANGKVPECSQRETLETLGGERLRDIAERYADAIDNGDINGLCSMLTAEATWSMPPHPRWYRGQDAIAEFHVREVSRLRWRHRPTRANGQLAVGCYIYDDDRDCFIASVLDVLTLDGGLIAAVTAFFTAHQMENLSSEVDQFVGAVDFARFGLPDSLPVLGEG